MRQYNTKITLVKNNRGVWDLDPFKGCYYGTIDNKRGCYGLCYAAKIAKFRGFDFSSVIYRDFENYKHIKEIGRQLKNIPFVRLGTMCDPSHDREHTLKIVELIKPYQKNIVIITKHWTVISDIQLIKLDGVCINTSISALDTDQQIKHRLQQYNRLKPYCNSVLRVNTVEFIDNLFNDKKNIQEILLKQEKVIDNILRMPKNCRYVNGKLVKVDKYKFLDTEIIASKNNKNNHFGFCKDCKEQCGINL